VPADPFAAVAALEGVPSAVASARDGIDARLRERGRRRTGPDVTAASLLLGAVASAALDGSVCTADDLRAGRGDPVAAGAQRLSAELLGMLPVWRTSPVQALARMHALAAPAGAADLGRPRSAGGAARLHALAGRLLAPTDAPALAIAAIVHAEVATIAAFGTYDAMVARGAERLVLVERGVDPASVTVPEAGHAATAQAYHTGLESYARDGTAGVRVWLLYAAQAYARGAQAAPLP